jgi:hypothetical protein
MAKDIATLEVDAKLPTLGRAIKQIGNLTQISVDFCRKDKKHCRHVQKNNFQNNHGQSGQQNMIPKSVHRLASTFSCEMANRNRNNIPNFRHPDCRGRPRHRVVV